MDAESSQGFPRVWRRFERRKEDGTILKFKIQETPKDLHEDLMTFMLEYFMRDETLNKAIGIEKDELAVKEFYEFQFSQLSEKLTLICLLDEPDVQYDMINNRPKILGHIILTIYKKDDPKENINANSKAMKILFQIFEELENHDDVYQRYNVNEYISDAGVSVHPDYRGYGICTELLSARIDICKSLGYKVSASTFTSPFSQRSAEKCGFEAYQEIPFSRMEEITHINFNEASKYIKIMAYVNK